MSGDNSFFESFSRGEIYFKQNIYFLEVLRFRGKTVSIYIIYLYHIVIKIVILYINKNNYTKYVHANNSLIQLCNRIGH